MSATVFYSDPAEQATLANTFSVAGVATDPTTVSLTITTPTGTATTYTYAAAQITRTGAGTYAKDVACTEPGTWVYAWVGTGTASDVQPGTWTVYTTDLSHLYCSMEELKSRFGIVDTVDDLEIKAAIEAASRWIDGYTDRYFWRATATRTYDPCSLYEVAIDDLVSLTSLQTDASGDGTFEVTWTTRDYQLRPQNPSAGPEVRPYTKILAVGGLVFPRPVGILARDDRVQVTGVFGWPAVPATVKSAALILSAEYLKLKDAPFGVAGYGDYGAVRIRDNPVVMSLLNPYRRNRFLVA